MQRKGQLGLPLGDDNPIKTFPFINWTLIGINIIVAIATFGWLEQAVLQFGFIPAQFSLLKLLTSMFMHGGLAHIAGNLWFLFIFGDNVEDRLGHFTYLAFYLLAGIGAGLAHYMIDPASAIPAVGASGAISGVLGAYLVFFPNAAVYVSGQYGHRGRVSAWIMLGLWFVFQFISGVGSLFSTEGSGIAFWAHIGGFVFGVLVAFAYKMFSKPKQ
jgi:membrane associated rhomboid family serine protease